MTTILVIFILSIQSSYATNSEVAATQKAFDTVQFYASSESAWRIKTYAQDQDVHIFSINSNASDILQLAKENTSKHYGDVLIEEYVIQTNEGLDGLRKELSRRGLDVNLEISSFGAVFWAPSGTSYRSKSTPKNY